MVAIYIFFFFRIYCQTRLYHFFPRRLLFRLVSFTLKVCTNYRHGVFTRTYLPIARNTLIQQRCGLLSCRLFFGINAISAVASLCRMPFRVVNWNKTRTRGNLPAWFLLFPFGNISLRVCGTYARILRIIFLAPQYNRYTHVISVWDMWSYWEIERRRVLKRKLS